MTQQKHISTTLAIALFELFAMWIDARYNYLNEKVEASRHLRQIEMLLEELDYCYGSEIYYNEHNMIRIKP